MSPGARRFFARSRSISSAATIFRERRERSRRRRQFLARGEKEVAAGALLLHPVGILLHPVGIRLDRDENGSRAPEKLLLGARSFSPGLL
jgi:hypothetical protein